MCCRTVQYQHPMRRYGTVWKDSAAWFCGIQDCISCFRTASSIIRKLAGVIQAFFQTGLLICQVPGIKYGTSNFGVIVRD